MWFVSFTGMRLPFCPVTQHKVTAQSRQSWAPRKCALGSGCPSPTLLERMGPCSTTGEGQLKRARITLLPGSTKYGGLISAHVLCVICGSHVWITDMYESILKDYSQIFFFCCVLPLREDSCIRFGRNSIILMLKP